VSDRIYFEFAEMKVACGQMARVRGAPFKWRSCWSRLFVWCGFIG